MNILCHIDEIWQVSFFSFFSHHFLKSFQKMLVITKGWSNFFLKRLINQEICFKLMDQSRLKVISTWCLWKINFVWIWTFSWNNNLQNWIYLVCWRNILFRTRRNFSFWRKTNLFSMLVSERDTEFECNESYLFSGEI
jgi:hypothetical protein